MIIEFILITKFSLNIKFDYFFLLPKIATDWLWLTGCLQNNVSFGPVIRLDY